jgi:hypothetical protein
MNLKFNRFPMASLIVTIIILSACGAKPNQSITLQPPPSLATFTLVPATSTSTITPTVTPTDWISVLLTTTPTMYPLPTFTPDCGTVKLGSAGTQSIDKSHKTLVQGTAILCGQIYFPVIGRPETITVPEALLDLDAGTIDADSADIEFCPGAGSMIFYGFCNANNSHVMVYSLNGLTMEHAKEPTFAECQGITKPISNDHDNEPEYACVITNLGNISRIKVEQYNPLGNDAMALEISFSTWEK